MYTLKKSKISFEDMFLRLAEERDVLKYNFVFYFGPMEVEKGYSPDYFEDNSLKDLKRDLGERFASSGSLALCSAVSLRGDERKYRIKQIDFNCPYNGKNLEKIRKELEVIKSGSGWLSISGYSLHFHGKEVLPEEDWKQWMKDVKKNFKWKKSTLDKKWVKKQLRKRLDRNISALRITGSESISFEPKIIFEIVD
jgi:hypothetical protein